MWHIFADRGLGVVSHILTALYPAACPLCKNPSDDFRVAPLCSACWNTVGRYSAPSCACCGLPIVSEYAELCSECLKEPPPFTKVHTYGLYDGALAEAIHLLKFSGLKRLAGPLGRLLTELPISGADCIIPVPLTPSSLRQRGFNQTVLLSRELSKHRGITLDLDTLFKERETEPQVILGAKERRKNLKNCFGTSRRIDGRKVLLVDDVMTTGATVRECSKTLIGAGASQVVVVTLARSVLS